MKKIFSKIHLWLSIPLGLLIFLICTTGAILVFRTEIEEASRPDLYFHSQTDGKKLSINEMIPVVNSQLDAETVTGISIPADPKRNYFVSTSSKRINCLFSQKPQTNQPDFLDKNP